jgi:Cys-tRNA(Pro)/Cys-tRNA(Cys) deacylase
MVCAKPRSLSFIRGVDRAATNSRPQECSGRMSKATRATQALARAGIAFTVHTYSYDPNADRIGMHAATALGVDPGCMLKTLMALVDGKPACAIVPSDRELSMKKMAAAFAGKHAEMMQPYDAERVSGYKVGGISPFGQTRKVQTAIDERALAYDHVYLNGGQRGLQVRLSPKDVLRLLDAVHGDLLS